jgi:hypothetical protein
MKEIFKGAATPEPGVVCGSVTRFLWGVAGEGDEARDGVSDLSPKDRGHCFDAWEEAGTLRRLHEKT